MIPMTPPAISEHHTPHFDYEGYFGLPAFCDLLIRWFNSSEKKSGEGEEGGESGGPCAVVVFTECNGNQGTSVTNRSEHLATRVVHEFHLNPLTTVFLEHYPKRGEARSLAESYALLTYAWLTSDQQALRPRWQYIPLEEAEHFLATGEPSPAFQYMPQQRMIGVVGKDIRVGRDEQGALGGGEGVGVVAKTQQEAQL